MPDVAMLGWSPVVDDTVRLPAVDTDAKFVVTGAYVVPVPTSKVRLTLLPTLTDFCRLPTTWPLVRLTVLAVSVLAPVVMLPAVNVSVPPTVALLESVTPAALFTVRLL